MVNSIAGRGRRLLRASLLAGAGVLVWGANVCSQPANAATPTPLAIYSCNPCSNITGIVDASYAFFSAKRAPSGTIVLMTSLNAPVSAFVQWRCRGLRAGCDAHSITADNAAAAALDNQIYARAAKIPPISVPQHLPYNEVEATIAAYLATQVVSTGQIGIDVWHGITNFPLVVWVTVVDMQTGNAYKLFVGDTITVNYPDGYSEKWQFLGPAAGSIQWRRVPNTLMHNGLPVLETGLRGSPFGDAGVMSTYAPFNPGTIYGIVPQPLCFGVTNTCLEDQCGVGTFVYPC
jgi:hypothetical protein